MGADYQKVTKLKGSDNYLQWEVSLRTALVINDVYDVVKEDFTPPDPKAIKTEASPKGFMSFYAYQKMDSRALATI